MGISCSKDNVNGTYNVGDYYNVSGLKGIVWSVSEDGKHGKLISIYEESLQWSTEEKTTNAKSQDGENNQLVIEQLVDWETKYPAFAYCSSQGEGWYLPGFDELRNFDSETDILTDAELLKKVNETLTSIGGDKLKGVGEYVQYWSSTESNASKANRWRMYHNPNDPSSLSLKSDYASVRAFHKF